MDQSTSGATSSSSPPKAIDRAPAAPHHPAGAGGGVKDTIESILVAFILAFIFRAFVVEAFVIPTGSMAPTLLGAHMRFTCADCGYDFTVNYQTASSESDDINIPRFAEFAEPRRDATGRYAYDPEGRMVFVAKPKVFAIYCPNCGFKIGDEEYAEKDHKPGDPPKVVTAPAVHYGDRILVLKYQYLLGEPKRWDVVVFKSPTEPEKWHYTQNYIKRLVGKPGETVMILDGDVYVTKDPADVPKLESFEIQTKPRIVQEALWRVVYDNDFYPQGVPRVSTQPWIQPWSPGDGAGWNLGTSTKPAGRVFQFDNASGSGTINFNPKANPSQRALTDWLAYDVTMDQNNAADTHRWANVGPDSSVSDVKLQFYYSRKSGDGPLRLSLTKLDREFVAEISPTSARLFQRAQGGDLKPVGAQVKLAAGSDPLRVEFSNVDYRVILRIDDQDVIATTPTDYAPDVKKLMEAFAAGQSLPQPKLQISAEKQTCSIEHLSLWRDIYYINSTRNARSVLSWAVPESYPNKLVRLGSQPGREEYFVLGDNSVISGDARYWTQEIDLPEEDLVVQAGRVPARFMLGKAFFVYWPAGYRPFSSAPGVVPNFGEMRFIH